MATILFTQYYEPTDSRRKMEIDRCFDHNIKNPMIDRIIVFSEKEVVDDKITWIPYKSRLTYSVWMNTIRELFDGDNHYILANSDIHFDGTLSNLNSINYGAIILSRYENGQLIWNHHDSQDVWILSSIGLIDDDMVSQSNFELGRPGCDNAIAWVFHKKGILSGNYAYDIITHHLHEDTYTNKAYTERDRVIRPYVFLEASKPTEAKKNIRYFYPAG